MEQQADAPDLTPQEIAELETRVYAAEQMAVSLERNVAELRDELVDNAVRADELAQAMVTVAEKDVEIARLVADVEALSAMVAPDERQVPGRVRRARAQRRASEQHAVRRGDAALGPRELGPLTVAEPALRWVGTVVEADK